jgi:hypothetical protein
MPEDVKTPEPSATPSESPKAPEPKVSATSATPPEGVKPEEKGTEIHTDPKGEKKDSTEKPAGEQKVVPEKYELKLPEGSLLDAKAMERIALIAKEQGLSNEEAQARLEAQNAEVSALVDAQKERWLQQAINDKEIGGAHFKENVALAWRFADRFCSPEFKAELDRFGYGNHPELIRAFAKAWKEGFSDDTFVKPGAKPVTQQAKPAHEILYGGTATEQVA